ncbi:MAG: FAD-binding protein [Planctomycetota bacterium]|nr:MAG: FAD-binding protein [Planctomycetota bacterium]
MSSAAAASRRGRPLAAALAADLRRIVGHRRVLDDPASLAAYESDALTLYRCRPGAVVLPGDRDELVACVRLLHRAGIPFAARGAGTGLSGGALVPPGGVILGLARMDRILELNPAERWARVEPGVVNAELSRAAAPHGLRYAPDPASQAVCTLGGNLAENSGGPQCFLHGMTAQHVLEAEVVLADGRCERWGGPTLESDDLDLRGFLVGSEGSVAIASEIRLRLVPLPEAVATLLGAFADLHAACEAVAEVVAAGLRPVAMEVMDRRAIRAVEASVYRAGLPTDAGAVLIVEVEGPAARIPEEAAEVEEILERHRPLRLERAANPAERAAIWKGRKGAGGAMGQLAPDSLVMDGVVPRSRLAEIMDFVLRVEEESGLPIANLFHAGDGNIHPHFAYDARDREQARRVEEAATRILRRCLDLGGSLSGEHGIGLEKEELLAEQFDPPTLELMRRVRRAFDPAGLLNPDKGLPLPRGCAEAFHRHRRYRDGRA